MGSVGRGCACSGWPRLPVTARVREDPVGQVEGHTAAITALRGRPSLLSAHLVLQPAQGSTPHRDFHPVPLALGAWENLLEA